MATELPTWATDRCHDCGELFLPNFGSVWYSGQPDRLTHGGLKYCRAQADYLASNPDALALYARLTHQALVEVTDSLQRFVSECSDKHWNKEVADVVFGAINSAERGLGSGKLIGAVA